MIAIEGAAERLLIEALNKSKERRAKHGSMSWQSDQENHILALTLEAVIENSEAK